MDVVKELSVRNGLQYNLLKSVEELLELSEVIQKKVLKIGRDKEPPDSAIIEEIGDVQIRLDILKEIFGHKPVQERIDYKLGKFEEYITENSYQYI